MLQNALDFAAARGEPSQSAPAAQALSEGRPRGRGIGGGRSATEAGRFARLLRQVQGGRVGQARLRAAALRDRPGLLGSLGEEEPGRLWNRLKVRLVGAAGLSGEGVKEAASGAQEPARAKTAAPSGRPERDAGKTRRTGKALPELPADLVGSAVLRRTEPAVKGELRAAGEGDRSAADSIRSERSGAAAARAGQARVVVLDLRKEEIKVDPSPADGPLHSRGAAPAFSRTSEGLEREFSVLFKGPAADRPGSSVSQPTETARTQQLAFQERFLPEVLRQTGIILKDGGAGEIRLVLKPDNLGSVRIRLALSESSLEGRIVVDNNSVKELVESSLDNLRNALRQEGYQTASLQVFVGNRRTSDGEARQQAEAAPARGKVGAEEFERAVPLLLELKPDYGLVNLIV